MKYCLLMQGHYAYTMQAVAENIKIDDPAAEFCAYAFSPEAAAYARTGQNTITYTTVLADHELHAQMENEKYDPEYIAYYEKKYGPPYIWQYIYCDRKLMMSIGPKEETTVEIDPLLSHEDLLRAFQVRARAIEAMIEKEKPDVVLFFAIGALGHLIVYHVAKKYGAKVLSVDFSRISNYSALSENYNTLTATEEKYKEFEKLDVETEHHQKAKAFIEHFRSTGSLDLEYMQVATKNNPLKARSMFRPERLLKTFLYLGTLTKNWWRNRNHFLYGETNINPIRFIVHNTRRKWRRWRGVDDILCDPDYTEQYAFFPLHYEPELAILLLSPFYFDQLNLIRYIARSLPATMKLYVKEHPAMIYRRSRRYYKELAKIPNVKLIKHTVKSYDIITHAQLVTTITSSAGWEACLLKKPVITFGNVFYNALPFVRRNKVLEDLPRLVREHIEHFKYDEKALLDFVAAAMATSFPFQYASLWYEKDIAQLRKSFSVQNICAEVKKRVFDLKKQ